MHQMEIGKLFDEGLRAMTETAMIDALQAYITTLVETKDKYAVASEYKVKNITHQL